MHSKQAFNFNRFLMNWYRSGKIYTDLSSWSEHVSPHVRDRF